MLGELDDMQIGLLTVAVMGQNLVLLSNAGSLQMHTHAGLLLQRSRWTAGMCWHSLPQLCLCVAAAQWWSEKVLPLYVCRSCCCVASDLIKDHKKL
jgi:hypothetical protein